MSASAELVVLTRLSVLCMIRLEQTRWQRGDGNSWWIRGSSLCCGPSVVFGGAVGGRGTEGPKLVHTSSV